MSTLRVTGCEGITVRPQTSIWVTFARHGIHCYPEAPFEVAYLRQPHRHLFQFKVSMPVFHDDREVEFHMLQNWIARQYETGVLNFDYKSCEMLAHELASALVDKYARSITVEVSEDGECGAVVSLTVVDPS